jgi:hypothetical protein
MTPDEIETDKKAWFDCWQMLKERRRPDIERWLSQMDEGKQADYRRRLNQIMKNRKRRK